MILITKLLMFIQGIKCGKKLKVRGIPCIVNKGQMTIGNNVTIKSSFLSNLIGLYQKSIIVTRTTSSKINIGDNVGMSGVTLYARDCISIGDNTIIGANTKIIDNDFHPLDPEDRINDVKNKIKAKPVIVGKNCFIGCNSIILKGTELGDNCIVGAGSVVSGKFEENSVIVGNPARKIK